MITICLVLTVVEDKVKLRRSSLPLNSTTQFGNFQARLMVGSRNSIKALYVNLISNFDPASHCGIDNMRAKGILPFY